MANAQELRITLVKVKQGFQEQQDWYLSLSLETRRDLRRPNPLERFKCAAILQHRPSTHGPYGYYVEGVEDLDLEENTDEPSAEICPFTDFYYAGIEKAQEALDNGEYEFATEHTSKAVAQLHEVREMLARMGKKPRKALREQDQWRTLWMWNDACYWVQKGASLEDAITRSLAFDRAWKLDDDASKTNGPRQYFFWDPMSLTYAADPIYVTDFTEIDYMQKPRFKPTAEEWDSLFADYKKTWSTITPHEFNFPHPLTIMRDIAPEPGYLDGQSEDVSIKVFFLRGAGFESLVVRDPYVFEQERFGLRATDMDKPQYALLGSPQECKALEKHLSRVELRRWHPDQLNKRTGVAGEIDQEIGQKEENRKVSLALKDLVDMLRNPLESFKHPMELDSRWEEHKKEMRFWKKGKDDLEEKMGENTAK